VRYDHIYYPNRDAVKIAPDDRLLLKGSATDLVKIIKSGDVALPHPDRAPELSTPGEENVTVEIIIPPLSYLIGARLMEVGFLRDPGLRVIAIQRSGLHYSGMKIHDIKLKLGDILLVQVPWEKLDGLRQVGDIIIVEDVHHRILDTSRVYTAGLIFLGVVSLASTGILNIMVSAIAGVFLMFLTGCLQVRDAYRALQGNVLMLIAGTIALGLALEKTGASRLYADMLLKALGGASPGVILATVILLTSISTQLLSNNATAVLVLPIAISAAVKLGVDPRPFIIAVCFGASACYATPIGYQTNLLVYGPGGYRFADYLKMGIPLNLMVLALGTVLIPIFWPF
jgi:di/tricarboxylate transporter